MCKIGLIGVVASAALVVASGSAAGQTPAHSLEDLARTLRPGERVTVTLQDGTRLNGRVASIEPEQVRLRSGSDLRALPVRDLNEVRKRGDRLWNGALIGAGIGALAGGVAGAAQTECRGDEGFCAGVGAFLGIPVGAVVGLVVDAALPHRTRLYARPEGPATTARLLVVPVVTSDRKGVRLAYVF